MRADPRTSRQQCLASRRPRGRFSRCRQRSLCHLVPPLGEQPPTDVDEIVRPARQQTKQDQPDQQQEVPVDRAELHAQAHLGHLGATPHLGSRSAQRHQTAHQVQPVRRGDHVEEGIGWIGRHEVARGPQLLPRQQLPNQECNGGCPPAHRPMMTSSMSSRRAATYAHCSATLLTTSTPC